MAKTSGQRMAAYRARQSAAGVVGVTIVLPKSDVLLFRQWASERRKEHASERRLTNIHLRQRRRVSKTDQSEVNLIFPSAHEPPLGTPKSDSDIVVARFIRSVAELGWPLGMRLGSETQLIAEYGCSRQVFLEAIHQLENWSVVSVRKGANSGLFVAQPSLHSTANAVRVYLQNRRINEMQILKLRVLLETESVARTVEQLTPTAIERLRADLALELTLSASSTPTALQRLHVTFAELSGDPALLLLTHAVLSLSDPLSTFPRLSAKVREKIVRRLKKFHAAIVDTIIRGNIISACSLMKQYLEKQYLESRLKK